MTHKTNPASHLPSPGCPLILTLADGTEVEGVRPGYIASRSASDKGYRTAAGEVIENVERWRYR